MNVFYEEDGGFKVGHVLTENDASFQVEAAHGKRSKIKAANVLLKFTQPGLSEFLPAAESEAANLDLDFLWEVAPREEFGIDLMASEYYGRAPAAVEAAALIMRLHGAPIYFHKKGRGRFKPAPEEALKAALASVARKKREAELQAAYAAALARFEVPDDLQGQIKSILFAPDKQSIGYKALDAACAQTGLAAPRLLHRAGVFTDAYDYFLERFLFEHFPERLGGRGFPAVSPGEAVPLNDLPLSDNGPAFSIDDSSTTEIDDAFSIGTVRPGVKRVGIHIAAPGLGFRPASPMDDIARQRLSTVYMPGDKITMLPDEVVQRYTLMAGRTMPAVSLYVDVNENDGGIIATFSRVDRVAMAANLRHDELDDLVTRENLEGGGGVYPYRDELAFLWRFANALEKLRGKPSTAAHMRDYAFKVDWAAGRTVTITERRRGAPLDKIVSELMILANSTWGKLLADKGAAGIYRVKTGVGMQGKVRMTAAPAPHIGLGVTHYAWSSSPLRRYVDLVNQWQLLAVLQEEKPPYEAKSENLLAAIAAFDAAYGAYAQVQETMETYWSQCWLEQGGWLNGDTLQGEVTRDGMVRLDAAPLRFPAAGLPALPPWTRVTVQVRAVDLWKGTVDAVFAGVVEEPALAVVEAAADDEEADASD